MRLVDLDPEWIFDYKTNEQHQRVMRRANDSHTHIAHGPDAEGYDRRADIPELSIANAQGVMFLCPVCFKKNGGSRGTESVLCWFKDRGVPDDAVPGPGRWAASGTGFEDLTLSPSVNVDHEHWHGWIQNGQMVGGGL